MKRKIFSPDLLDYQHENKNKIILIENSNSGYTEVSVGSDIDIITKAIAKDKKDSLEMRRLWPWMTKGEK